MTPPTAINWDEYLQLVRGDLLRYGMDLSNILGCLIKHIGFRYTFFMRSCRFLKGKIWLFPLFVFARLIHGRLKIKYGIDIPYNTSIGTGLYIGHYGGIVVNQEVVLGKNCNINHGVTIGISFGGKSPGCPRIGDNVFFGAGCKVFGRITLGDDVAVGANCVVTRSVPDHGVVVGIPGKVISYNGSAHYVVNRV
ncbi:serine O-acetyltransferase [Desulfocicer niacini]